MMFRTGSRIVVWLALIALAIPARAQTAGSSPADPATANYKDLTQAPAVYVANTSAEKRAKKIADIVTANALSFKIALSMPDDPGQRQGFINDLEQSTASPADVQAYLDQVSLVTKEALDLINKGSADAKDSEIAVLATAAQEMRTLEAKISNGSSQPDGSQLNTESLKPVTDTKAKHIINDLVQLSLGGGTKLNDVAADQYNTTRDDLLRTRVHELVVISKETDPIKKSELSQKLNPLVEQEINGALWQYREVIALIVAGLDHPDQNAIDVFNTVLDEMDHVTAEERHLF